MKPPSEPISITHYDRCRNIIGSCFCFKNFFKNREFSPSRKKTNGSVLAVAVSVVVGGLGVLMIFCLCSVCRFSIVCVMSWYLAFFLCGFRFRYRFFSRIGVAFFVVYFCCTFVAFVSIVSQRFWLLFLSFICAYFLTYHIMTLFFFTLLFFLLLLLFHWFHMFVFCRFCGRVFYRVCFCRCCGSFAVYN